MQLTHGFSCFNVQGESELGKRKYCWCVRLWTLTELCTRAVYALTVSTVAFSRVDSVLEFAKRNDIRMDLVDYLEHTAASKVFSLSITLQLPC